MNSNAPVESETGRDLNSVEVSFGLHFSNDLPEQAISCLPKTCELCGHDFMRPLGSRQKYCSQCENWRETLPPNEQEELRRLEGESRSINRDIEGNGKLVPVAHLDVSNNRQNQRAAQESEFENRVAEYRPVEDPEQECLRNELETLLCLREKLNQSGHALPCKLCRRPVPLGRIIDIEEILCEQCKPSTVFPSPLTPQEQAAFDFRRRGMKQREIAAELGISQYKVSRRLKSADQKLRSDIRQRRKPA